MLLVHKVLKSCELVAYIFSLVVLSMHNRGLPINKIFPLPSLSSLRRYGHNTPVKFEMTEVAAVRF